MESVTPIPRIVHQLWRVDTVPRRWAAAVQSVRKYHKGWEYRLWTDSQIDAYVRSHHADFYPLFAGFNRHIMRIDVFRYLLMHDIGGLYCDLDYEFVRPFDYSAAELLLSLEYDESFGDDSNQVANYIFASVPGHPLWADIIADLRAHPPFTATAFDVCTATGPQLVTRVFVPNRNRYGPVLLTPKPVLSPRRVHGRRERKYYINSGITYGFHHGWGSWRERFTLLHVKSKLAKWFGIESLKYRPRPLGGRRGA